MTLVSFFIIKKIEFNFIQFMFCRIENEILVFVGNTDSMFEVSGE